MRNESQFDRFYFQADLIFFRLICVAEIGKGDVFMYFTKIFEMCGKIEMGTVFHLCATF